MKTIIIRYRRILKDPRYYYYVSNEQINVMSDYIILEFDYKIFFGRIQRHATMYIMKDTVESIFLRVSEIKKEKVIV